MVAGSIISCIAYAVLIMIIGWHNEDASVADTSYDAEGECWVRMVWGEIRDAVGWTGQEPLLLLPAHGLLTCVVHHAPHGEPC